MATRQNDHLDDLGSSMTFLASIGANAPFIGLFGTVWGIMVAFVGIAETQTTSLAVVAPGIAGALLATAAGLAAAIPAVLIYNFAAKQISKQGNKLEGEHHYRRAIHLFPYDPFMSYNLAQQYQSAGIIRGAILMYRWTFEIESWRGSPAS